MPKALVLVIHSNDSNVPKVASNCLTANDCFGVRIQLVSHERLLLRKLNLKYLSIFSFTSFAPIYILD